MPEGASNTFWCQINAPFPVSKFFENFVQEIVNVKSVISCLVMNDSLSSFLQELIPKLKRSF